MYRTRYSSPLLTNLALGLLGAILLGLSRHLAVEFDHFVYGYSETSTFAMAAALGAAWIVVTQPVDRFTFPIIAAFAVLCRLALLMPEPNLSSDIYRYVWDGMVQHHGVNPYHYFPGNDHLKAFRDDDIFPNINRRDYAPTIYPPVAQLFFFCVTWISSTLTMMKLAMTAMEAVAVFALARLLQGLGRKREEVILYAWSPLCIWEFGSSGHLDAAVIAMVALALLFRFRNRPVLTGVALGAAIMFKFYPLVLFPALWRRRDWKMPAAATAVILAGYAVYAGVGMKVFGFAGGYAQEEGMNTGSRFFLYDAVHRSARPPRFVRGPIPRRGRPLLHSSPGLVLARRRTRRRTGHPRPARSLHSPRHGNRLRHDAGLLPSLPVVRRLAAPLHRPRAQPARARLHLQRLLLAHHGVLRTRPENVLCQYLDLRGDGNCLCPGRAVETLAQPPEPPRTGLRPCPFPSSSPL